MPEVVHAKSAGGDYKKGSPLYQKQESRKADAPNKTLEPPPPPGSMSPQSPSSPRDAFRWLEATVLAASVLGNWGRGLSYFFAYFIIVMFIAMIWMKGIRGRTRRGYDERRNMPPGFAYGLFSMDHCFGHHANVCLCSWCCTPLRLADTYAKEPFPLIGNFWTALIMLTCLLGLSQLSLGATGALLLVLAVYFRQRLRQQYQLETGGVVLIKDLLAWCLCPFCAVAQEARQVEFVKKPNDPVK